MAESEEDDRSTREPFVSKADRPAVKIDLDTPLSQLRVRELSAILGFMVGKNPNFEVGKTGVKDFFDKPFPEVAKDWVKESKFEKLEKNEKFEVKEKDKDKEKPEKFEKHEKIEKPEKPEVKEAKFEKLEGDAVVSEAGLKPDPRMEQIIQAVAGLTRQVGQLVNQVEELRKKALG